MKKHIDEVEIKSYLGKNTILASKQTGNVVVECFGETITDAENTAEIVAHCLNTHQMLLDALKPFAQNGFTEKLGGNVQGDDSIIFQRQQSKITLGDCRRALKAIEAGSFVEVSE